MRNLVSRCALGALLLCVALVPAAGASPASDFAAVVKDFASDRDITSCRFAVSQLANARGQVTADVDAYAPGLAAEIDRELRRWRDGDCTAKATAKAGVTTLKIVKVSPKGGASKESVTIRNTGRKAVNLRRYVLRDAADHAIRFTKTTIRAGKSLRVVTGCRKGSKKAVRKGTSYYACRTKQFWNDAGDVVELLTPQGALLSRRTYGTPPA